MGEPRWYVLPTLLFLLSLLCGLEGSLHNDNLPIKVVWTVKRPEIEQPLKVTIHDLHGTSIDEMFKHYADLRTKEVENSIKSNYFLTNLESEKIDAEEKKKDVLKKFVHHTIEAVSSNYDYEDCGVTVNNGSINLQYCPGPLTVITTNHIGVYSCNSVKSLSVYGPVIIKSPKCSEQILSKGDCNLAKQHNFIDNDCHEVYVDNGVNYYLTIVVILVCLNILTLVGLIRFCRNFNKIKKHYNYKMTPVGIKLHNFSRFDSERGNVESRQEEDFNETPILNKRHISWVKVVLLILFCRPISIDSYELLNTQNISYSVFKYTISMGSSETIQIGSQQIKFVDSNSESRLVHLFESYDWSANFENKYYCLQSGCNNKLTCREDLLPFTKASNKLEDEFPNFKGRITYYSCKNMRAYCSFANGCFIMAFALNLDESKKFSIFRVSQQSRISGDVLLPPGCYLDEYKPERSAGVDDMYYVESASGEGWFCHPSTYSHYPLPHSLGDLKVGENGTINFLSDFMKCSTDNWRDVFCSQPDSFLSHINEYCVKNSLEEVGVSIKRIADSLVWPADKMETIKISCDRDLKLLHSDHHCDNIQIEIWDTGNLQSDLLMSVYAESKSGIGVYILSQTVHAESHHFGCNSVWHNTFLFDLLSLNSSGIPYKLHKSIRPPIDDENQGKEIKPINEDHWYNIGLGNWFKNIKEWLTGLSSFSLVALCLVFLFVLRR